MTAANEVQLLLKTANKNIPNYDPNIDGQGLLDLNRATQPIGNLGISMTGRTGTAVPVSGVLAVSHVSSNTVAKLSSVSVVDASQRDFTANLNPAVAANTLMQSSVMLDADPGANWSGRWTGLMAGQNLQTPIYTQQQGQESTVTIDSRLFNSAGPSRQVTMTTSQYNPFVYFSGMFGQTQSSTTVEYSELTRNVGQGWWTQTGAMVTMVKYDANMVTRVSPIVSVHAMAGYQLQDWNMFVGVKPTVVWGQLTMTTPASVDPDGTMNYSQTRNNLAGNAPVPYVGVKYQHTLGPGQIVGFRSMISNDGSHGSRVYYTWMF